MNLKTIKDEVEAEFNISLVEKTRKRNHTNAMKAYSVLSRKLTKEPYQAIGDFIDKHHATILHHFRDGEFIAMYDKDLGDKIKNIENRLRNLSSTVDLLKQKDDYWILYVNGNDMGVWEKSQLRHLIGKIDNEIS
jgi:hypothetical protein